MAIRTGLGGLHGRWLVLVVVALVLGVGGTAWATTRGSGAANAPTPILSPVSKGTVRQMVSTTGTRSARATG